jgi:hypothetical protein
VLHAVDNMPLWRIPYGSNTTSVVKGNTDEAPYCAQRIKPMEVAHEEALSRGLAGYVGQIEAERKVLSPDNMSVLEAIITRTVETQLQHQGILPPKKGTMPPRHVEDLSDSELLAWRPNRWPLQGVRPVSKSDRAFPSALPVKGPVERFEQPALQIGSYQFTPFSFQPPTEEIQSVTTVSSNPSAGALRPQGQRSVTPSMMTAEDPLSYNATLSTADVSSVEFQGGNMVDLSGYKDLTKPPVSPNGDESPEAYTIETEYTPMSSATTTYTSSNNFGANPHPEVNEADLEIYAEYSGNVKTLVQLVNDLPEGVTKQTGAQIIRLTMEAMGISMETVLSDAQSAQSQLLDAVRSNIKKIEEYKTVIRKLESEIRFHQGKANELSEIIDLFILSNTSPKMPNMDRPDHNQ